MFKKPNQGASSSSDFTLNAPSSSSNSRNAPQPTEPLPTLIVMGKTGSGKSSLIKLLGGKDVHTGKEPAVDEGTSSCTPKPTMYTAAVDGKTIILVDTPGFDDSVRENVGPLRDIVCLLYSMALRPADFQLHGVIFLHDISELKMSGSQLKTLSILEYMCGDECMKNVIVGTTMWAAAGSAMFKRQETREVDIRDEHWEEMLKTTRLFEGDDQAAVQVARDLLQRPAVILQVQKEMLKPPHRITDTTVGRIIIPNVSEEVKLAKREIAVLKSKQVEESAKKHAKRMLRIESLQQQIKEAEEGLEGLAEPKTKEKLWEWLGELTFVQKIGMALVTPIVVIPAAALSVPVFLLAAMTGLGGRRKK